MWVDRLLNYIAQFVYDLFLRPGALFFVGSLFCALAIATIHIIRRRQRKGRRVRLKTVIAGLFPSRMIKHRSMRADIFMFFINTLLTGIVIGWAILGFASVATALQSLFTSAFGAQPATTMPEWAARSLATLIFFLAYELGYWIDHYLKHRIPLLWEFHKVHHSAEHLTPLTVTRMHPIDSWIFGNILAITIGVAAGIYAWAMGGTVKGYTLTGTNVILVFFIHIYVHLQHSEFWIAFTGWRGKLFMSPAHHQIHHSKSVRHFDKNMGSCLALWDWMFGTLFMPSKEKQKLRFGISAKGRDVHEMGEALVGPFRDAGAHVLPKPKPPRVEPAE